MGQPGQRDRRGLGQGEEAKGQPRSDRQPRDQRLDSRGLVQVLGDLVGVADRADPRAVAGEPLRQADRRQTSPFVAAQCRRGTPAAVPRASSPLGASGAVGAFDLGPVGSEATATQQPSVTVPFNARRAACGPCGEALRSRLPPHPAGPKAPYPTTVPPPSATASCGPAVPRPAPARWCGPGSRSCAA